MKMSLREAAPTPIFGVLYDVNAAFNKIYPGDSPNVNQNALFMAAHICSRPILRIDKGE